MKKDNFDLRSYLIENKMTENSRGDVRHQLGETILDTRILSEMQIPVDPDQDDPDYEANADQLDDMWNSQMDAGLDECGDLGGDIPLDEAGYTDDEDDDDFVDDIPEDPRARRAAERAMKSDDPDHDYDIDHDDTVSPDAVEDEPAVPPVGRNKWVTGDLTMDNLFGPDAANVEIFGDSDDDNENLKQLFARHKNYRPNILKTTVKQAMQYFRDYEKPDSLYLIPAIDRGGYEMRRFNPGNRAVAVVYRPEELSGKSWADQI